MQTLYHNTHYSINTTLSTSSDPSSPRLCHIIFFNHVGRADRVEFLHVSTRSTRPKILKTAPQRCHLNCQHYKSCSRIRHRDRSMRRVREPRPRQNHREKQRHCQHRHFHFNYQQKRPLTSFASSYATSFASTAFLKTSDKLPLRAQDQLEVDTGQVGRSQVKASKNP